jgi:polyvinyl alcohol dehydrogenase (cytochrome)
MQQPRPADNDAHCRNQDEEDACGNPGSALFEFAAAPALAHLPDGRDLVLAGQKSGVLYALDPDQGGRVVWQVRVGEGGSLGGVQHGFVVDGATAYVPVSDSAVQPPFRAGGLAAVDLATGRLLRRTAAPPAACAWTGGSCGSAFASSPAAIPGVVFAGAWDGHMRAFGMTDGRVLWDTDTARPVDAVNGVKAVGGAIGGYPVIAAGGALYVTSGGGVLENEGNALLAYTVDGR